MQFLLVDVHVLRHHLLKRWTFLHFLAFSPLPKIIVYVSIFLDSMLFHLSICLIFYQRHTILVQFSHSHVQLFATPWTAIRQASPSITNYCSLLKLVSTESVMPSNHCILCHPLLFLPSIFPSIRVFANESVLRIRWPEYWGFSFSISPSKEYSGLISFRMDWLDLLAVEGTLKSLLQHHSLKASILWHSAFFSWLSYPFLVNFLWRM